MSTAGLDNLTLARKEGWQRFVQATARVRPKPLARGQIGGLREGARADYDRRREWHVNLGPLRTPQLAGLHEDLWDIVDSNAHDGDKAKGAVAIDAVPGLGKTTSVLAFAKQFHLREIAEHGDRTPQVNRRYSASPHRRRASHQVATGSGYAFFRRTGSGSVACEWRHVPSYKRRHPQGAAAFVSRRPRSLGTTRVPARGHRR